MIWGSVPTTVSVVGLYVSREDGGGGWSESYIVTGLAVTKDYNNIIKHHNDP